jgi:hypothetical protein
MYKNNAKDFLGNKLLKFLEHEIVLLGKETKISELVKGSQFEILSSVG